MGQNAALNRFRRIMSLITVGTPLAQVLEAIISAVEEEDPAIACSIYLLDRASGMLSLSAAPSLPERYRENVLQAPIGPDVGSCPVAAFRNERVVVEDIQTDPRWTPIKHLVEGTGFRACWSEPIRGREGEVLGTFAIYRSQVGGPRPQDISFMQNAAELASHAIGRSQAEQELKAARDAAEDAIREARQAERLAGIGYWRYDIADDAFTWSDQMYQIYGVKPSNLKSLLDFCHPDDRELVAAREAKYRGKEAPPLEARIVRPDGEVRHVISRDTLERDKDGVAVARFGTLQDVTEIRRAEARALDGERRYRFITENAHDMIVRVSLDLRLNYVSPGSMRVFGYTPEEMAKLSPHDMTHPDDVAMVDAVIDDLVARRLPNLAEPLRYRARRKDGRWIWVESNPALLFNAEGVPVETIDIIRDITDSKEAEAALEEARARAETAAAAKAAFLANMSHELRTPLTSIIGFSRLLREGEDLPAHAQGYAHRIFEASEALLAIINDVLDFSKLEAGQVDLERLPLSVESLVDEVKGLLSVQAAAKGVALEVELDPALPAFVEGDVARLRQVLLNFMSNAVKFTDQGSVSIRAGYDRAAQRLRLCVSDTGPGMSPEAVSRLFERFSQADVSINRTHGGTGLGLAISKAIVTLMNGEIGVLTEPGQGAAFWFDVPAPTSSQTLHELTKESANIEHPGLSVLVVDDTAVNRELVRLMLEPLGIRVTEADGGAEGVQAAMNTPFDLILMDVRMPGVDGLEATRVIRGASLANRITPIIALTADVQPESAAACRAVGMSSVLAKPIVPQLLVAAIASYATERHENLVQAG
jgi:PAS domain S-box-containing protein